VNTWIPLIVSAVAAVTALAGYLLNSTINRRVEKARYYAEALNAVEKYRALPYIFKRRHDSSEETRAELAKEITDIQANLRFYQGWLQLDSLEVGAAYNDLVSKIREKNGEYRREALSSPPAKEDRDIEIAPYEFDDQAEHDYCVAAMRQELKLFKWPSGSNFPLKRNGQSLPGTTNRQHPQRPPEIPDT
jgi:hypothetical protein